MSQDPVEVVRDQFEAVNERDFPRAMGHYADDVVLVVAPAWGITAGTYEGREAVGEWFGDWFRAFADDYRFEIMEARELGGGAVYVAARHRGSGKASGIGVHAETGYLYRVVRGKVTRVELYGAPAEALEAASLPEWSDGETD